MLSKDMGKKEQIDELAKKFEGVLIRQFLDEALKPMDGEGGIFGTGNTPMYDQMIKDTLTESITKGGSLGFSSVLQAQLYNETLDVSEGTKSDG